jgi:hypothetical protein
MKFSNRVIRVGGLALVSLTLLGLGLALAQTGGYFQNYPGGTVRAVYRVATEGLSQPITLGWQVEPVGADPMSGRELLKVTTTNEVVAERDELETGVASGMAQIQLVLSDEAVRALLDNRANLQPNQLYILSGGAHFTTGARETIAGVPVLCGVLTDPQKPDRRTFLAIADEPTVPFPPWIQLEENRPAGGGLGPSELGVCRSLSATALIGALGRSFVIVFKLDLIEFERRE